jgi:hypothetical protein
VFGGCPGVVFLTVYRSVLVASTMYVFLSAYVDVALSGSDSGSDAVYLPISLSSHVSTVSLYRALSVSLSSLGIGV